MVATSEKLFGVIPLDWRWEITKYPIVRKVLESRWMPLSLILFNLFMFTVILVGGVIGWTGPGNYNFGIMIVWILWWVALMLVLVPVGSRSWCTMCPLPVLGEWLQRKQIYGVQRGKMLGLGKRWPKSLSNMWLMNFLFVITTYASGFMTTRPIATFILLAGIILASIVLSMIFQKRTFCLYVCPVSGFQGLYANFGMTEVRVKDPDICAGHYPKTCITGNEEGHGCPWALLPFSLKRNTYCGMCFECIKSCPHDNMVVNIRPPGTDILVDDHRRLDESWKAFIMLGIATDYYLILQGPWGFLKNMANAKTLSEYLIFVVMHTLFVMAIIPAVYFVFAWLSKIFAGKKEVPLKKIFVNFSYTLIPLGLAAWIAFSLAILFPNSSYVLHVISDPFAWGWNLLGTANFPWTPFLTGWVPPLQIATMIVGFLFAADYGLKLARQTFPANPAYIRGYLPILLFLTLSTVGLLWVFVG